MRVTMRAPALSFEVRVLVGRATLVIFGDDFPPRSVRWFLRSPALMMSNRILIVRPGERCYQPPTCLRLFAADE